MLNLSNVRFDVCGFIFSTFSTNEIDPFSAYHSFFMSQFKQDDDEVSEAVGGLVSAAKAAFKDKVKERVGNLATKVTKGLKGAENLGLKGTQKSLRGMDDTKLIENTIDDGKEIVGKQTRKPNKLWR